MTVVTQSIYIQTNDSYCFKTIEFKYPALHDCRVDSVDTYWDIVYTYKSSGLSLLRITEKGSIATKL